jgi:hypothetical protein
MFIQQAIIIGIGGSFAPAALDVELAIQRVTHARCCAHQIASTHRSCTFLAGLVQQSALLAVCFHLVFLSAHSGLPHSLSFQSYHWLPACEQPVYCQGMLPFFVQVSIAGIRLGVLCQLFTALDTTASCIVHCLQTSDADWLSAPCCCLLLCHL